MTITPEMPAAQPAATPDMPDDKSKSARLLLTIARMVSAAYSPFYLPVVAYVVLFMFSYLNMLPLLTKVWLTVVVYFFTVLLPHVSIYAYRKVNGWTRHQMSRRERRYVPYVLSIVSYGALLYLFYNIHMPHFAIGVVAGAFIIQVVCAVVNNFIKISTHAAASAGVVGAMMAYAFIFNFYPIRSLCVTILLCGMVSSARLILRQHTYAEIGWGVAVGFLSGFVSILLF